MSETRKPYKYPYTPHPDIHHVSASQIGTFASCQRVWYYERWCGLPRTPPSKAQAFGSEFHREVEEWIQSGKPPTMQLAKRLVSRLSGLKGAADSPDGPYVEVEGAIELTLAGVPVEGYVDVVLFLRELWEIWDHKSCGGFKFSKTAEELVSDIQMNIYAQWLFNRQPDVHALKVGHNQANRNTFALRHPSVVVTRKSVAKHIARIEDIVRDMIRVKQTCTDVSQVPPNKGHCSAYGGCPHRSYCGQMPPTPLAHTLLAPQKDTPMTPALQARLNAMRAKQGLPPLGAPAPSPPPSPSPSAKPAYNLAAEVDAISPATAITLAKRAVSSLADLKALTPDTLAAMLPDVPADTVIQILKEIGTLPNTQAAVAVANALSPGVTYPPADKIKPPDARPNLEPTPPAPPSVPGGLLDKDIACLKSMSKLVLASFKGAGMLKIRDLRHRHAQGGDAMFLPLKGVGQPRVDKILAELDALGVPEHDPAKQAAQVDADQAAAALDAVSEGMSQDVQEHPELAQVMESRTSPLLDQPTVVDCRSEKHMAVLQQGPTLLINATVLNGECCDLAEFLVPYTDRVLVHLNKTFWRKAPANYWDMPEDYFNGRKALTAMHEEIVEDWLAKGPITWACSTSSPSVQCLMDYLKRAAGTVIVGV